MDFNPFKPQQTDFEPNPDIKSSSDLLFNEPPQFDTAFVHSTDQQAPVNKHNNNNNDLVTPIKMQDDGDDLITERATVQTEQQQQHNQHSKTYQPEERTHRAFDQPIDHREDRRDERTNKYPTESSSRPYDQPIDRDDRREERREERYRDDRRDTSRYPLEPRDDRREDRNTSRYPIESSRPYEQYPNEQRDDRNNRYTRHDIPNSPRHHQPVERQRTPSPSRSSNNDKQIISAPMQARVQRLETELQAVKAFTFNPRVQESVQHLQYMLRLLPTDPFRFSPQEYQQLCSNWWTTCTSKYKQLVQHLSQLYAERNQDIKQLVPTLHPKQIAEYQRVQMDMYQLIDRLRKIMD